MIKNWIYVCVRISYMQQRQQAGMAGCGNSLKLSPDGGVEGVYRDQRSVHQRVFLQAP